MTTKVVGTEVWGGGNGASGESTNRKLTIRVVTWNVHGKTPNDLNVNDNYDHVFQNELKPV